MEQTLGQTAEQQQEMFDIINDVQIGVLDESRMNKLKTWFIQGDGIYEIYKNEIGTFGFRKNKIDIPGLPKKFSKEVLFDFSKPKISLTIYNQILSFFRGVMKEHNNAEAFLQVFFDKEEQKYIVFVPKQSVSGARVAYKNEDNLYLNNPERYIFVFECHSHNNMGAFWSATDNADEKELRFYGVFGKLGSKNHEEKFRIIINGVSVALNAEDIFELENINVDFPEEWLNSINTTSVITPDHKQYGGHIWREDISTQDHTKHNPAFVGKKAYEEETLDMFNDSILENNKSDDNEIDDEIDFDELVEMIEDATDGFCDRLNTEVFLETLDGWNLLRPLEIIIKEHYRDEAFESNQEGYNDSYAM